MNLLTAMSEAIIQALMAHGVAGIIVIAFAEASFLPIPPDVLLVPAAVLNPVKALVYAFLCTIASSVGRLFGWEIGRKLGRAVLSRTALRNILPVRYVLGLSRFQRGSLPQRRCRPHDGWREHAQNFARRSPHG